MSGGDFKSNPYWCGSPSIDEIAPQLFVGDVVAALDPLTLQKHNITAVVTLLAKSLDDNVDKQASEGYPQMQNKLLEIRRTMVPRSRNLHIPLFDSNDQDMLGRMPEICDFIDQHLHNFYDGNALVHCYAGSSRSPAAAMAYLMRKDHADFGSTFALMRQKRGRTDISQAFLKQLKTWKEVGYDPWEYDSRGKVQKREYAELLEHLEHVVLEEKWMNMSIYD
ncbi:protein-tyrosine phosphatase-like protein [Bombardia bombarda]|uniref:protein-tyrosine-phosphatase n=1 Tax=Bombardia bombarda TaxID=252184 RepID=A0AA39XMW5_9PEZI|nr:protein-tyrosine phosphatase-like protein [Bombardia bombarda]